MNINVNHGTDTFPKGEFTSDSQPTSVMVHSIFVLWDSFCGGLQLNQVGIRGNP